MDSDFLLVTDAARLLGVAPSTLRVWGASGQVAEYRHPKNNYRMYKKIDLERLSNEIAVSGSKGRQPRTRPKRPQFIDLFAGCGGLSLGLLQAGWSGRFAIEMNPDAFITLADNLVVSRKRHRPRKVKTFLWPEWLPVKQLSIQNLLKDYAASLKKERGRIDLVVGGPPCQGFSFAGRRQAADPRNKLFEHYIEFVSIVQPKLVLMENVKGMSAKFQTKKGRGISYSEKVKRSLEKIGFVNIEQANVQSADFGVPQSRIRFITFAVHKDSYLSRVDFFSILDELRPNFLVRNGLGPETTTVRDAISDLRVQRSGMLTQNCDDPESPKGFQELVYDRPLTRYQELMHGNMNGSQVNSLRIAKHRSAVIERFKAIHRACEEGKQARGVQLSAEIKQELGISKRTTVPLHGDKPAPTITTLPDDMIHYCEPRIHTVREHARLQSFPDWFEFHGKYTTGGSRRRHECPRYTQVGNAVPPLLAEALGIALRKVLNDHL